MLMERRKSRRMLLSFCLMGRLMPRRFAGYFPGDLRRKALPEPQLAGERNPRVWWHQFLKDPMWTSNPKTAGRTGIPRTGTWKRPRLECGRAINLIPEG